MLHIDIFFLGEYCLNSRSMRFQPLPKVNLIPYSPALPKAKFSIQQHSMIHSRSANIADEHDKHGAVAGNSRQWRHQEFWQSESPET